ncbi:MAG: TonB-dependent receptor plug domain-containing protein, partial [Gemmatimonadetes bacterium]|nr:TonB-dependent receptor plug domain-containing protein [Gemmatimonadota bacterium]
MRPAPVHRVLFLLAMIVALPVSVRATPDSSRAIVRLRVTDAASGEPVPFANVVRLDQPGGWLCDGHGLCHPRLDPATEVRVRALHVGYDDSDEIRFRAASDDTVTVVVRMTPRPVEIPTITVSARAEPNLRDAAAAVQTIDSESATPLPNPADDAFQMLRVLPGVTSGDIGNEFRLRGGGVEETLVRVDGLEVRELFHGRDFGGLTGIVPFSAVQRMDVYSAGFPARYGGRLSGVVELELRERGEEGWHGRVAADLTSARALVERHDEGSSIFLSSREGYLDRVLGRMTSGTVVEPAYRDQLLRIVTRTGGAGTFTFNALRSEDHARFEDGIVDHQVDADYLDEYAWATWRAHLGSRLVARSTAWLARTDQERRSAEDRREDLSSWRRGVRTELTLSLGAHRLTTGGQVEHEDGDYAIRSTNVALVDEDGQLYSFAALDRAGDFVRRRYSWFVQDELTWRRLTLNGGVRFENGLHQESARRDPRVSAAFLASSSTTLHAAWGRYGQSAGLRLSGPSDFPLLSERTQEAEHFVFGVEQRVGTIRLGADVWRKDFPVLDGVVTRTIEGATEQHLIQNGSAEGMELWLRSSGPTASWWFAYSLGRSRWSDGDRFFARDFDQLHTVAIANTWTLARNWDLGVAYRFHTGTPYTRQSWNQDGGPDWILTEGIPNAQRLPDYHRIDVRLRRWFRFDGWEMSVYADALNLTNHDNVLWYAWRFR